MNTNLIGFGNSHLPNANRSFIFEITEYLGTYLQLCLSLTSSVKITEMAQLDRTKIT